MVERLSFQGGTVFANVDEPGGVWASVKELELCGGDAEKTAEGILYEIVGGCRRQVMNSMSYCVLLPAVDISQARGKYYGRIVTSS